VFQANRETLMGERLLIYDEEGQIERDIVFDNPNQIRLFMFGEGKPSVYGKLPWRVVRPLLREWLKHQAGNPDLQEALDEAEEVGQIEARLEAWVKVLNDETGDLKDHLKEIYGKREGLVILHVYQEIYGFLNELVKRKEARLIWHVEETVCGTNVYETLLRGGLG
jgi:hypothetical protein